MNQRVKIAGAVGLVVALVGGGVWLGTRASDELPGPVDDGRLGSCEPAGHGRVDGDVAGESVGPVEAAWYVAFLGGVYALVLDEKPSSCGAPADEGQHLALFFPCGPLVPGTYPITRTEVEQAQACDAPFASAALEEGPRKRTPADGGKVVIEQVGDCIRGTFEATFEGGDKMSGWFNARVCADD